MACGVAGISHGADCIIDQSMTDDRWISCLREDRRGNGGCCSPRSFPERQRGQCGAMYSRCRWPECPAAGSAAGHSPSPTRLGRHQPVHSAEEPQWHRRHRSPCSIPSWRRRHGTEQVPLQTSCNPSVSAGLVVGNTTRYTGRKPCDAARPDKSIEYLPATMGPAGMTSPRLRSTAPGPVRSLTSRSLSSGLSTTVRQLCPDHRGSRGLDGQWRM